MVGGMFTPTVFHRHPRIFDLVDLALRASLTWLAKEETILSIGGEQAVSGLFRLRDMRRAEVEGFDRSS